VSLLGRRSEMNGTAVEKPEVFSVKWIAQTTERHHNHSARVDAQEFSDTLTAAIFTSSYPFLERKFEYLEYMTHWLSPKLSQLTHSIQVLNLFSHGRY